MAVVAQGHVSDRPFVRTLFTIAAKRFSGDLVMLQEGAEYRLAWHRGLIAGASIPGVEGALVDRACAVFRLDDATYELHDESAVESQVGDRPLDARWVIFHGLLEHYDDERLMSELSMLANHAVQVSPDALAAIDAYGIEDADRPWVKRLLDKMWDVEDLVAEAATDEQKRRLRALLYALLATDALRIEVSRRQGAMPATSGRVPRTSARQPAASARTARQPSRPAAPSASQPKAPASKPKPAPAPAAAPDRSRPLSVDPLDPSVRKSVDFRTLITTKVQQVAAGANHFELFDLPKTASKIEIQKVYFELARKLHPDRVKAAGLGDLAGPAGQLFARVNEAFGVLGDDKQRKQYLADLAAGVTDQDDAQAEAKMLAILEAEEKFRLGEMAMRRQHWSQALEDFQAAVDLNPDEGDHHAMAAWARWRDAANKDEVAEATKLGFRAAIRLSPKSTTAFFLRGKLAKELGDLDGALFCFDTVLALDNKHSEADLERRLLRERIAEEQGTGKKKGGLLGKLRG